MLDYALLDALAAVVRHGSFDRAANELNVTPSAVSQRVKLLEERVGSVLVKRGQPCVATTSGALLCRHTERVQLLEAELGGRLPTLPGPRSVQGAVTTQAEPVQGCRSTRLGRMRYLAVCEPRYFERHFAEGVTRETLRVAPCVDFNPKDQLQKRFMRRITRAELDPPLHWIPHVAGFLRACVTGLGWGMCPERMVAPYLARGELVEMTPGKHLDVDLYWQSWRLSIGWLDDFGAELRRRAAEFLD